eukprot:TRINITY_DN66469_c0_g1_i1.p1 TRINITY_DN66469_c0_g1~~TRINITY_DN66469_c0_g1_i1.p1  ORF type:complete len:430 (+),score=66.98 TRINITY_DN66469_c0_g1_i1:76-1365(+)
MFGQSDSGERKRRIPHYAQKTVSHTAPEFANHEQDVIRQSFSTGNHTWMKEALPVELGPDTVNLLRRQRMERNRLAEPVPQTWSKMTQLWGGGYYQEFEYMPEEYQDKNGFLQGRQCDKTKIQEIGHNHEWRNNSQERRLKYEPLLYSMANEKEPYPYLGGDRDAELEAGKQWLMGRAAATKSTGGWTQDKAGATTEFSFLAGKGKGLDDNSRGSRMTLPTMVQRLQRKVDEDWEGSTVVVSTTDQDLIQIAFHMNTVDSERGVVAYMGVLSKDVDLLGSLGLRKVSQLWGMQRDFADELGRGNEEQGAHIWMFFLLMPKWVRMRPTDAYYTVHPRSQGSAFRMSTAGSSVLLSLGSSVLESSGLPKDDVRSRSGAQTARETSRRQGPDNRGFQVAAAPSPQKVSLSLIEQAVSSLPIIQERGRFGQSQ